MNTLDSIRKKITFLWKNYPHIHVNVSIAHPRINLRNAPAKITGVYPNIFLIEENSQGYTRKHSLTYNHLLTKQIEIIEISDTPNK